MVPAITQARIESADQLLRIKYMLEGIRNNGHWNAASLSLLEATQIGVDTLINTAMKE